MLCFVIHATRGPLPTLLHRTAVSRAAVDVCTVREEMNWLWNLDTYGMVEPGDYVSNRLF